MIKRIIRQTAAVVVFALAVLVFSSGPANAMTPHATTVVGAQAELAAHPVFVQMRSQSQCNGPNGGPAYLLCVWDGPNYTGGFYSWNTYWLGFCVPVGDPFRNAVTSGWNNMPGYHYDFYDNMGCNSKLFGWNYGAHGNWDFASDRMESFKGY